MHARCSQYKLKLRGLAQELEEAESRTASVQEIADLRADEVCPHLNAFTLHAVLYPCKTWYGTCGMLSCIVCLDTACSMVCLNMYCA